jgi:hypothetical protein
MPIKLDNTSWVNPLFNIASYNVSYVTNNIKLYDVLIPVFKDILVIS